MPSLSVISVKSKSLSGFQYQAPEPPNKDWECELLDETTVVYHNFRKLLRVLLSVCVEEDGKQWLHVSLSHKHRLPQWKELVEIKELFIGSDKVAYQILPETEKYVNISTRVLNLWTCLDGPVTPDFTRGNGGL